jgi:hypothetical protein
MNPVRKTPLLPALAFVAFAAMFGFYPSAYGQKPEAAKPTPDVLIFTNGDQLTGKLQGASGGNIIFASDMAGTLTISFDKIKELRSGSSPAQFALLKKGIPVNKSTPAPEGTAEVAAGNVMIHPDAPAENASSSSTPASVPTKDVDYLIAKADFDKEIRGKHKFTDGWNGAATGGATLVRSTQTGTTLTAALNLVRALPGVAWLAPKNRSTINVAESYGKNTTPGAIPQTTPPTPSVTTLTNIFHADAEQDRYFTPRFYALGDVAFDHNYSQGLKLQDTFGGGVGWTAIKTAKQELDFKVDLHYARQTFIPPTTGPVAPSVSLIGSTIFEGYRRDLPKKMVFTQTANVLPAFNHFSDYSYNLTASLAIPVFKRISASIMTTDNFLNDPPNGYNKNSYQFITGVTYTIR